MRIRKAVITVTLAAAAIGGTAASALAAPAAPAAHTPSVAHNVGGALLTRQWVHVGETINLVGSAGGRISNYRVTAVHRDGEAYFVTVWPRLQSQAGSLVLFNASN